MQQLYLLDAYALIYRAFFPFAQRPRLDSKGNNVSAVYGFINSFNDILSSFRPEYIAVVFDPPGGSFRNEFYPEYKANRSETPEGIRFGVPYIKQFLAAMNIPILEVAGYEADDVIGTLSVKAEAAGYEVLMVTPDKDYSQLVTPMVSVLSPISGGGYEEIGVADVCQKFGVKSPRQVIDILGIMGDSADNFPGIKGVGISGAQKLLAQYDSLEGVLEHAEEIKGAIGEKVRASKEMALISKRLATIALDVPINFEPESYKRTPPDMPRVQQILGELELRTQLRRMVELYGSGAKDSQLEGITKESPDDLISQNLEADFKTYNLTEPQHADTLKARLPHSRELYIYAMLWGEDSLDQTMLSLGIVDGEHSQAVYYLPLIESIFFDPRELFHSLIGLISPDCQVVAHDAKALLLALRHRGISLQAKWEDTMIAHYLLMPDASHQLPSLTARYLGLELISLEELISPQKPSKLDIYNIDEKRLESYTAERAFALRHLHLYLQHELQKREQLHLLHQLELPLMPILLQMEVEGIRIDEGELARQGVALEAELNLLEQEIHSLVGHEFNVNSPRQVGEVLFEELMLDSKAKKTKTGTYTTGEEVLEKYRDKHPVVGKILEYRASRKLLSTYILALPKLADHEGRVHTSFNQTVAATGRLSSSNPNIQNIPIRTAVGRRVRAAFVPNAGEVFLSADYSQIELRLMAHFSQDPALIEAFNSGQDIHQATAARISGVRLEEVTPDMRRRAKTANFGIIYGVSAFGLAEQLGISRGEAKKLIDGYFSSYPSVEAYMKQVVAEARARGYVQTLIGRRRYLSDIDSSNAVVRGYAERNAINAPLQGTAADIIKQAMIYVDEALKAGGYRTRMLLQVHDELNFSVPQEELEPVSHLIRQCMIRAGEGLRVALEVGIGTGQNWLEAH